jgi:hypothetical protein
VLTGRTLIAAVVAALTTTACGIEPGSGQCRATTLTAAPATMSSPLDRLALSATLVAGGRPVAGGEVRFYIVTVKGPGVAPGTPGGRSVGSARTGADGVARFDRRQGIDGLVDPGERVTGYEAEFVAFDKIEGVNYCRAETEAPITGL